MKKINIHDKADIHAEGNLNTKHCKPVICVDTGEVFTSMTDAAEAAGVSVGNMSCHLTGRYRTVKGKRYCYLSKVTESLDTIVTRLRETSSMEADAQKWREHQAEQERIRKAEEKRREEERKAEENRKAEIAKLQAKRASLNNKISEYSSKWDEAISELAKVERELESLGVTIEDEDVA
jgi:phage-related minor tail protein